MTLSILLEHTNGLMQRLYQCSSDLNPTRLFDATELHDYAQQSPIWLEGAASAAILDRMQGAPEEWAGLIIESQTSSEILLAHLRHILFVHFDTTRRAVLRYSSPTTASYFFTVNDATTLSTWMGPIARLSWFGGTWADSAQDTLRWFNVDNPAAPAWKQPAEQRTLHLSALQEAALQRQQTEHFVHQWWCKQGAVSFADATGFLHEGISNGFIEAQDLEQYLSLRAHYPVTQPPHIPREGSNEDRLRQLQQNLTHNDQGKESLT